MEKNQKKLARFQLLWAFLMKILKAKLFLLVTFSKIQLIIDKTNILILEVKNLMNKNIFKT
jgi:hypothetical protein